LDGKKPFFQVRTKLVSSVFSDDEKLHNFFTAVHDAQKPGNDDVLLKGVDDLKQASSSAIVQFGPVILDELFRVLGQSYPTDDIPRRAFLAVIDVVSTINAEKTSASRRDHSLVAYVYYRYANHSSSKKLAFEEITRFWVTMIEEKHPSTRNLEKFSWFFFELVIKRYHLFPLPPLSFSWDWFGFSTFCLCTLAPFNTSRKHTNGSHPWPPMSSGSSQGF